MVTSTVVLKSILRDTLHVGQKIYWSKEGHVSEGIVSIIDRKNHITNSTTVTIILDDGGEVQTSVKNLAPDKRFVSRYNEYLDKLNECIFEENCSSFSAKDKIATELDLIKL